MLAGDARPGLAARYLTARRVRLQAAVLALCLWSVYAVDMATPGLLDRAGNIKWQDYLQFYALGSFAQRHDVAALSSMRAQALAYQKIVPQSTRIVLIALVYGPQASLLFAPLACLRFTTSAVLWIAISILLYAAGCWAVWRTCPNLRDLRGTVWLLAAAYPPWFHLVVRGQISALFLACFVLAYLALRRQHFVLAGLAIGCLALKPSLGLAAAVVFLLARQWRVVGGAVLSAAAQAGLACAYYGRAAITNYADVLRHLDDIRPFLEMGAFQKHSLRSFWSLLLPWEGVAASLYVLTGLLVLGLALRSWQSKAPLPLRYSALLLATVLAAPHLLVYDLLVLAPALLLIGDWAQAHGDDPRAPGLSLLLYICYGLPLLGPLTRLTHVQLSVIAMATLQWRLWRLCRAGHAAPQPVTSRQVAGTA